MVSFNEELISKEFKKKTSRRNNRYEAEDSLINFDLS